MTCSRVGFRGCPPRRPCLGLSAGGPSRGCDEPGPRWAGRCHRYSDARYARRPPDGTAAGRRSAEVGAYYAGRGNRFWRTLHETGLTPQRLEPDAFRDLLTVGIGLTDLCKSEAGMDRDITLASYNLGRFDGLLQLHKPRAIAFTSKRAASIYLRTPSRRIAYGKQPSVAAKHIFVLPSPSGAASGYWSIGPWQDLAASMRDLDEHAQNA